MSENTTIGTCGRLGNQLIRNIIASAIAKTHDLKFSYSCEKEHELLGIPLFTSGTVTFPTESGVKYFRDDDFGTCMDSSISLNQNINVFFAFCQTPQTARYIREFLNDKFVKNEIRFKNKYKDRYRNNESVFVHVRLGDASKHTPKFDYYDKALSSITFTDGFISSDSINDELCQKLIQKYNLTPIASFDEVETIMFGSTCKNLILSAGTFSWMIGILSFDSADIIRPHNKYLLTWHGDIFGFEDWKICD